MPGKFKKTFVEDLFEFMGDDLHQHDPKFIDQVLPYFDLLQKYFRYETVGLQNIPKNKPCLLVLNHGIIPYHGFLLGKKMVQERGIYPRGLGASFLFSLPFVKDFFLRGGTVNASDENAKNLLKEKHCLMVAPGGIYEGLVVKPGMTRIPWERRKGFVRLAVEADACIVPTYCDGINDVYYNSDFLLKWRIKINEKTRFSLPLFMGLGLLPFPKKLVHFIGNPISVQKKKGESQKEQVSRIHSEVLEVMKRMAE